METSELIFTIFWIVILIGGAGLVARAFWTREKGNRLKPMANACGIPADPTGKAALEVEKSRNKCFGSGGMGLG